MTYGALPLAAMSRMPRSARGSLPCTTSFTTRRRLPSTRPSSTRASRLVHGMSSTATSFSASGREGSVTRWAAVVAPCTTRICRVVGSSHRPRGSTEPWSMPLRARLASHHARGSAAGSMPTTAPVGPVSAPAITVMYPALAPPSTTTSPGRTMAMSARVTWCSHQPLLSSSEGRTTESLAAARNRMGRPPTGAPPTSATSTAPSSAAMAFSCPPANSGAVRMRVMKRSQVMPSAISACQWATSSALGSRPRIPA